jgi:UDPglucose 6-dehydrogenase
MARGIGAAPLLAEATDATNVAQTDRLARIVQARLSDGNAVGILGLSYKTDTNVVEESPGVALARLLADAGYDVSVFDPVATGAAAAVLGESVRTASSVSELVGRSDVVVITTPWPEFRVLPAEAVRRDGERLVVIDCWHVLPDEQDGEAVEIVRLGRAVEESAAGVRISTEG